MAKKDCLGVIAQTLIELYDEGIYSYEDCLYTLETGYLMKNIDIIEKDIVFSFLYNKNFKNRLDRFIN